MITLLFTGKCVLSVVTPLRYGFSYVSVIINGINFIYSLRTLL